MAWHFWNFWNWKLTIKNCNFINEVNCVNTVQLFKNFHELELADILIDDELFTNAHEIWRNLVHLTMSSVFFWLDDDMSSKVASGIALLHTLTHLELIECNITDETSKYMFFFNWMVQEYDH